MTLLALGGIARVTEWALARIERRSAARAKLAADREAEYRAEYRRVTQRLEGIIDQQGRELTAHEKNCKHNRVTLDKLQEDVRALRGEVEALRKENADLRSEVLVLQNQREIADEELARLRAKERRT